MNIERPKRGYYDQQTWLNPSVAESQARYCFAAKEIAPPLTNGLNLIGDMACGIGESTSFLENRLKNIEHRDIRMIGVDIDTDSVKAANNRNLKNHRYIKTDLGKAGLKSTISTINNGEADFDGIACIETIEHITPTDAVNILLSNLNALLINKGGTLVISTPNRRFFANERYRPYSIFHTQEFNIDEFGEVLDTAKFDFKIYSQRPVSSRLVQAFNGLRELADKIPKYRRLIGKIISMSTNAGNLNPNVVEWNDNGRYEPKYLVAVCRPR